MDASDRRAARAYSLISGPAPVDCVSHDPTLRTPAGQARIVDRYNLYDIPSTGASGSGPAEGTSTAGPRHRSGAARRGGRSARQCPAATPCGARTPRQRHGSMSRSLTVALGQLRWSANPGRNLDRSLPLAEEGSAGGADVVILAELAVPGYTTEHAVLARAAEALNDPTVQAWQRTAGACGGHIAAGFCERDGDRLFNTAVIVSGDGAVAHYRKTHLFAAEKTVFAPGDVGFPALITSRASFGLCICYDLRFVEVLRILALQGAEMILVPSAWVGGFDRGAFAGTSFPGQVAGVLAQANLNQIFVVAVSFAGVGAGVEFLGRSVVAGPYGDALAGPAPPDEECLCFAKVEMDQVAEAGRRTALITPAQDRRRNLYCVTYQGRNLKGRRCGPRRSAAVGHNPPSRLCRWCPVRLLMSRASREATADD
jgi:N-carbamoylputrescine amidase